MPGVRTEDDEFTGEDVIVLGGGSLGLALADAVSSRNPGLRVSVFAGRVLPAASRAAGAMLAPCSEITAASRERSDHPTRMAWATSARDSWAELLDGVHVDGVPIISGRGSFVIRNTMSNHLEDENFRAIEAELQLRGVSHSHLDPAEVPGLAPSPLARPQSALHIDSELTVDSALVHRWQLERLRQRPNVRVIERAARPLVVGDRLQGVETVGGDVVRASQVVVAAGVMSRTLLPQGVRELTPPILPGAGGAIVLAGTGSTGIESCIRTPNRAFACGLHVLPTGNGRTYVGATNNVLEEPWHRLSLSDAEFLARCARTQINTALAHAGIAEVRAGNRPVPLDLLPIVGQTSLEGLWMMTGTYREGLTLAPALADALATELVDGTLALPPQWRPDRRPEPMLDRARAVEETVAHHMAVVAEHELDAGQAGIQEQLTDFYRRQTEDAYDAWGDLHPVPPEVLAWISPTSRPGQEIIAYLDGWKGR